MKGLVPAAKRLIPIFAAALILGCGYRFTQNRPLPYDIDTLAIGVLRNHTMETGFDAVLTASLVRAFAIKGGVRMAQADQADAVLSGAFHTPGETTISRESRHKPLERNLRIVLELRLTDASGQELWHLRQVADSETFQVGGDYRQTDMNKHEALQQLADRLAETVYNRLTLGSPPIAD